MKDGGHVNGNDAANYLLGNAGANQLDGKGGADYMVGYGGDDVYFVDSPGDVVVEGVGGGVDTVYSYVTDFARPAQIEFLYIWSGNEWHLA